MNEKIRLEPPSEVAFTEDELQALIPQLTMHIETMDEAIEETRRALDEMKAKRNALAQALDKLVLA